MAVKLATLTMRREGTFHQLVEGTHHCGPASQVIDHVDNRPLDDAKRSGKKPLVRVEGKAITIRYNLTVACGPTLDHRGFLFDQTMVAVWFERMGLYPSSLSCEALVIKLGNQLQDKIARDAAHCDVRALTLQFSPAPYQASVSAHFIREVP